jgi:hypothetical protein
LYEIKKKYGNLKRNFDSMSNYAAGDKAEASKMKTM